MSSTSLDIARVRSAFPALENSDYIYADNAGGSQCLASVVDKLSDYLLRTNVQPGANYSVSVQSTTRVAQGVEAARELFNAASTEEVSFGTSSSLLVENLARAIDADILDGEEIIVTGEHEANAGPWKKLAKRRGLAVKFWHATQISEFPNNPYAVALQTETLLGLITPKTRLIAFTGCSNLLGSIVPVKEIIAAARAKAKEVGARKLEVSVDMVSYAPHRRVDVQDWDVEYCFFSLYKVYGPHLAALYTRKTSLQNSLTALTHHFLPFDSTSLKLQPGGPGYELPYAITAIPEYLRSLTPSGTLEDAFKAIADHEQTLVQPLLAYLKSQESRGVHIVGDENASLSRVPTISFVVQGEKPIPSREVVKAFDDKGYIGIRNGHFYAYTLVEHLNPKLDLVDAVVRISLVHYNTVEEVQTIISILKRILEA
ncbi:PLP-dependent transferase [Irpex rosettiformis]|uniref:PLP-dependent transferase n=1 Tax=Irpex rosettiformis TaxID=378272 RepID=A0ACB8U998_9APHY|nr:PLP-dependent transferase [Irpex rosettiformis]